MAGASSGRGKDFPASARFAGPRNFDASWEITHAFEASDSFVLISNVEFPFGFFAAGIHGNITKFRHGNLFESIFQSRRGAYSERLARLLIEIGPDQNRHERLEIRLCPFHEFGAPLNARPANGWHVALHMSDVGLHAAKGDAVRAKTKPEVQRKIDKKIREQIIHYASQPKEVISRRIFELEREWDIDRVLVTNASSIGLAGFIWGITVNKKCLLITGAVLSFLLLQAVQGSCPPAPVLRKLGVRTRREIDRELFALKVLRGDFATISSDLGEGQSETGAKALASALAH